MKKRRVETNPFDDLKTATIANRNRDYFITREDADKILEACPDAQWRLIFALSRFGGLRCPSEHLALTWDCVDWEHKRMTVISPKTEHHEGGGSRVIPLFPELLPHLEAVWEQAEPGTTHVITRYRSSSVNLRTQFTKIIKRASLKQWPKLFHNLRATRQTELADSYPAHVVCSWLGNTKGVAMKHYLQTTEEHFEAATAGEQKTTAPKALQKATQSVQETPRNSPQAKTPSQRKTPVLQGLTGFCESLQVQGIAGFALRSSGLRSVVMGTAP